VTVDYVVLLSVLIVHASPLLVDAGAAMSEHRATIGRCPYLRTCRRDAT